MALDRPLTPVGARGRERARRSPRRPRAAPVRARPVGIPPPDANGRSAGADPPAGDGDARRSSPRCCSRASMLHECSTSGPARARSRSRSRTSIPGALVTGLDILAGCAGPRLPRTPLGRGSSSIWSSEISSTGFPPGPGISIVSNPPYVDAGDVPNLEPEVRDWEPHKALTAHGAVDAVARGPLTCSPLAVGSCSRWAPGRRRRQPISSRSSDSTTSR